MIEMILTAIGMLAVTILIQYFAWRTKKFMNFWCGTSVIYAICVLGILTESPTYFAAILGYIAGNDVGRQAGWHSHKS